MIWKIPAATVLLAVSLAACGAYRPFEYVDTNNTIVGPGLFTGEDGEWVIYRKR